MAEADGQASFTLRYRLTTADARRALWSAAPEWTPWLIGVALLTLVCATWRPLGEGGRVGAIFFPSMTLLAILWLLNRTTKAIEPYLGKDFVLSFDAGGLRLESALAKTEMPWTTVRGVARRRSFWFFDARNGSRVFVPAAAIPAEARAFVARWAGEAGARLT